MFSAIIVLHVVVCLALIFIVLLQHGRGAEMGSGFGGGSNQTLFGSGGAGTFLGKVTTAAAVAFMITSLTLAFMSTKRRTSSHLITQEESRPAPKPGQAVPSPAAPAVPIPEAPAPKP